MKRIFIGHRGVGKTQLLKRHQRYYPQIPHLDLDSELEKRTHQNISDFFQKFGEEEFRKKEIEVLNQITTDSTDYVISLGAGFNLSYIPSDCEVVFISRTTDRDGRIFFNRPRLNLELTALEEYQKRFSERQPRYMKDADWIYHLPEGIEGPDSTEERIFKNDFKLDRAFYTLTESELSNIKILMNQFSKIELRTDLISSDQIENLLNLYPNHNWLISIRTSNDRQFKNASYIDVDVKCPYPQANIISSHAENINEAISQLDSVKSQAHLKLSPLVENFEDLIKGYKWQQFDAENRSFLPRSHYGKWKWFRLLSIYWQKLNFVRNFTDIADQPSLYEFLLLPLEKPLNFGAVIGSPIHHSRSPYEHKTFTSLFTQIEMSTSEFTDYFDFLIQLGLQYVAVTSPLKEKAFQISSKKTIEAQSLKAANTLKVLPGEISAHNTDILGFQKLVESLKDGESVAVWGGGGTLEMMKSVLPNAHFYSSQTGLLRDSGLKGSHNYDYLIWAAPRSENTLWPTGSIQVKTVIDLNYTDNSMGLEFASHKKIGYISGLEMFRVQAMYQQKFWRDDERK